MIKKVLVYGFLALLIVAGWIAWKMLQPPPEDLDLRQNKLSDGGHFQVTFVPNEGQPEVGPISIWHAEIKTVDGAPVSGANVFVDGGMPQHGHGLPTAPQSQGEVSKGVYAIDGVKFSMRGWWEFTLTIRADGLEDTVTFNRVLE